MTDTTETVAEVDLSGLRIPKTLQPDAGQILALTTPFCAEYLDEEYGQLCRSLLGMLARKRPSPLARGDLRVWAAAIIYAVGANNFLFDRASEPFLSGDDLAALTGVAKSTMANKARAIRQALDLDSLEPRLCRRELLEQHPYAWYVEIDGLLLDARALPAHLQDEARRRGLIPDLIPDRAASSGC